MLICVINLIYATYFLNIELLAEKRFTGVITISKMLFYNFKREKMSRKKMEKLDL